MFKKNGSLEFVYICFEHVALHDYDRDNSWHFLRRIERNFAWSSLLLFEIECQDLHLRHSLTFAKKKKEKKGPLHRADIASI